MTIDVKLSNDLEVEVISNGKFIDIYDCQANELIGWAEYSIPDGVEKDENIKALFISDLEKILAIN